MKKLLLIDDDRVFTAIVENSSGDFGFDIESVHSFKNLKSIKLEDYDAFVVDYDLGDGTGEQVLEFLSEHKIDRPIAMISSTNHVEEVHSQVAANPYTFVSKWQDTTSFFEKLQNVFAKPHLSIALVD